MYHTDYALFTLSWHDRKCGSIAIQLAKIACVFSLYLKHSATLVIAKPLVGIEIITQALKLQTNSDLYTFTLIVVW